MRDYLAAAVQFRVGSLFLQQRGDEWVVLTEGRAILNRDGGWEHDPLPSSRTIAFNARTRWATLDEAWDAAERVAGTKEEA